MKLGTKVALGLGGLTAGFLAVARRRRPRASTERARLRQQLLVGDAGPPPRPCPGVRQGDQEGLLVLRPGETRYLHCGGLAAGQAVVVLPTGDYEAYQRNLGARGAGQAVLVDVDLRERETVVTWMVVMGGRLELCARALEDDRELVCHVVATHPHNRFARF